MKHTTLILIFILTITTQSYSKGKCTFTVTIDCPKADSLYWSSSVVISKLKKYKILNFLKQGEKMTLPKGAYGFSIFSEFGDDIDTIISLDKDTMNIVLKINWSYIFQNYSNSIFETEGDTIDIDYERKFCSGGDCAHDWEMMRLFRTKDGKYLSRHFDTIKTENCLESSKITWKEDLLAIEKTKIIQNYFLSNYIPIDKREQRECIVKIGHHIYFMKAYTYLKFREELLKQ